MFGGGALTAMMVPVVARLCGMRDGLLPTLDQDREYHRPYRVDLIFGSAA